MSITFAPVVPNAMVRVGCPCGSKVNGTIFETQQGAYRAVYVDKSMPIPACGDEYCAASLGASFVEVEPAPYVNVSNMNAVALFDVLGWMVGSSFEDRCCGLMSSFDFMGRVLTADALSLVDAGVPATQDGIMVECGRAEGYVNARLVELREVAEYALANGFNVAWS